MILSLPPSCEHCFVFQDTVSAAVFRPAVNSGDPPDFLLRGRICECKCPTESHRTFCLRALSLHRAQRSWCENAGGDPPHDSPRASGCVDDVSNMRQMQTEMWMIYGSGWKRGATNVGNPEEDVERAFGDNHLHRCRCDGNKNTWFPQQNSHVASWLCLLLQRSPERSGAFCVVVNTSDQRISCCVVWKIG